MALVGVARGAGSQLPRLDSLWARETSAVLFTEMDLVLGAAAAASWRGAVAVDGVGW